MGIGHWALQGELKIDKSESQVEEFKDVEGVEQKLRGYRSLDTASPASAQL